MGGSGLPIPPPGYVTAVDDLFIQPNLPGTTADIGLALATTLPAHDASLFVDHPAAGSLLDAVGYPIAADVGLVTLAGGLELEVLLNAVTTTVTDLMSLIP